MYQSYDGRLRLRSLPESEQNEAFEPLLFLKPRA